MSPRGQGPGAAAVERALASLPAPEALVSEEQLAALEELDTATLRSLRARCETAEEGVSYARRVLQGRLDILRASLVAREDPGTTDLLDALP
ncbi:MAG: ABC transporter substrate-binding protein, partial [Nitriliruptoraceae bacterium]